MSLRVHCVRTATCHSNRVTLENYCRIFLPVSTLVPVSVSFTLFLIFLAPCHSLFCPVVSWNVYTFKCACLFKEFLMYMQPHTRGILKVTSNNFRGRPAGAEEWLLFSTQLLQTQNLALVEVAFMLPSAGNKPNKNFSFAQKILHAEKHSLDTTLNLAVHWCCSTVALNLHLNEPQQKLFESSCTYLAFPPAKL